MEFVDIVDGHDKVLRKASRKEAHSKQLLHRGVIVVVFDSDGRVFVQRRSPDKDMFPDCLEASLSGHVLSGETYRNAAVRELREELSIVTAPAKLKSVLKFGFQEDKERMWVYLFVLKDFHDKIKVDKEEVVSGEFWSLKKVQKELNHPDCKLHPLFKKVFEFLKDMKESPVEFVKL